MSHSVNIRYVRYLVYNLWGRVKVSTHRLRTTELSHSSNLSLPDVFKDTMLSPRPQRRCLAVPFSAWHRVRGTSPIQGMGPWGKWAYVWIKVGTTLLPKPASQRSQRTHKLPTACSLLPVTCVENKDTLLFSPLHFQVYISLFPKLSVDLHVCHSALSPLCNTHTQ